MPQPNWPTIKEAADRLGVSIQYVHRLVTQGKIGGRMRGDVWLLDTASLAAYEASRTRKPGRKKRTT